MNEEYQCTNCRYKFTPKKGNAGKCPYCSKETLEKVKSAQDYINETIGEL